jgi:hypothetical protein
LPRRHVPYVVQEIRHELPACRTLATAQRFLDALEGIERAELADDELEHALVEAALADRADGHPLIVTFSHARVTGLPAGLDDAAAQFRRPANLDQSGAKPSRPPVPFGTTARHADHMTAAQLEARNTTEHEVVAWRFEQLQSAGYPALDAQALSECLYVDLHQAVDLLRRGCPRELAISILI